MTFKDAIAASDAILFVTPEYNRSIPGGLKNAIDWASRPYGKNAFTRKPSAVEGQVNDEPTAKFLRHYMAEFHAFIVRAYTVLPRNVQEELAA